MSSSALVHFTRTYCRGMGPRCTGDWSTNSVCVCFSLRPTRIASTTYRAKKQHAGIDMLYVYTRYLQLSCVYTRSGIYCLTCTMLHLVLRISYTERTSININNADCECCITFWHCCTRLSGTVPGTLVYNTNK